MQFGARITRIAHKHHDDHEEKVETGESEADAVDGKVAEYGGAVEELIVVDDEGHRDVGTNTGQDFLERFA